MNLIQSLIKNYFLYPSHNAYKTIKMAEIFLKNNGAEITDNNEKYEELIKINSIKELEDNINLSHLFYKIQIYGKKTREICRNLSILKGRNFNELNILNLYNLKLNDISSISNCSFPKLEKLDFECNELTDNCLNVIETLKLPHLKLISFFDNKLTSLKMFEVIKNFKSLETLYIGKNLFNINESLKHNIMYELPPNIIEFGIIYNFNEETNKFITNNLNIENIKILFISGNEFTTFKDFKKIKFKHLDFFWSMGDKKQKCLTNINEIEYLQSKETIKKIVLKGNKINNIEDIVKIIHKFPKLEILNIKDNGIEKERIENVIKILKEKGFINLEIQYN